MRRYAGGTGRAAQGKLKPNGQLKEGLLLKHISRKAIRRHSCSMASQISRESSYSPQER